MLARGLFTQNVENLNLGPLKTNPSIGRKEDWKTGPPVYKSGALTTRPRPLQLIEIIFRLKCLVGESSVRDTPREIENLSFYIKENVF